MFLDADVFVRPDTLARLAGAFADPEVDAVFGSYDTTPAAPNFISHYKNLLHHYVHQTSHARASTFWSGCGAVKRSVFSAAGGFDPKFTRPMVEDIELGMRLHKANRQIALDKQVQVTHAKQWSLGGMIRSDICDRAIPWTQLILREKTLPNDLNLSWHQRLSAALACGLFAVLLAGSLQYPVLLVIPLLILALVLAIDRWSERERIPTAARWAGVFVMLSVLGVAGFFLHGLALVILALSLGIVCLNARFYAFFVRERNLLFALAIFPLHLVYYAYSVLSFASVVACHLIRKASLAAGWRSLSVGRRKGGAGWVDPQDGEHALGRTLSEKVNEDPA